MFKNFWEKVKQEPIVFMFRKMWEFKEDLRNKILLMWFLSVLSRLVWMLPVFILGLLLNEIQNNGVAENSVNYIVLLIAGIFAANLLAWTLHGPSRVMERLIGYKIDRYYKKYLYNAVTALPLTWHTDHDSGDTIDKVNKATESLFQFSRSTFILVGVVVRVVATTGVLMFFSVPVSIIALAFLVFGIYILLKFDVILIPQYKEINEYDNKASAKVYDALSNITTVKVLSIEKPILEGVGNSWWASYNIYVKNKLLVEWKWFAGSNLFNLLVIVPLAVYVVFEYKTGGVVLVGTLSSMYLYLRDFAEVYHTIAGSYDDISIQKSRVLGVKEIEDNFKKISKVKKKNFKGWESLKVENLKFKYDENLESHSLDIENLEIRKGEKIALIGESGSGKSTILKVIHGMYESASANVNIDVKNYKTNFVDMNLHSTLVPQEPEVFSASIKENITLLLNFKEEEIERATKMAEFYEVAEGLPKGLDSVVNEKGVNLSGGQKQRLALSRALLFSAEKEIILLDESTSSVDPVNEVKIYKNIFDNFPGVTILASIHKMNLLKYFDRIIILENGKIKIQGSFDYLLDADQEFKNAWDEFVKENN
jgi:ABC-type bacteriocin/lantibiotic exporter with double-glycine peptidase domain